MTLTIKIVHDLLGGPKYAIGKIGVLAVLTIGSAIGQMRQFNELSSAYQIKLADIANAADCTLVAVLCVLIVGEAVRSTNRLIAMNDKMKEKRKARKAWHR